MLSSKFILRVYLYNQTTELVVCLIKIPTHLNEAYLSPLQRKPRKVPRPQTPSNAGAAGRPTPSEKLSGSSNTRSTTVGAPSRAATVHRRRPRRRTPIRRMPSPWKQPTRTRSWTRCPASQRPSTRGAADWRVRRRLRVRDRIPEVRSTSRQAPARRLKDGRKHRTRTRKIFRRSRRPNL